MSRTYTEDEVREMIMKYPEGSIEKKQEFLKHAGLEEERHIAQFLVTVSTKKGCHSNAVNSSNVKCLFGDGIRASRDWVATNGYRLDKVEPYDAKS